MKPRRFENSCSTPPQRRSGTLQIDSPREKRPNGKKGERGKARILIQRQSYPTETVLSNKITRNRIVLSYKDSPIKPLRRQPIVVQNHGLAFKALPPLQAGGDKFPYTWDFRAIC